MHSIFPENNKISIQFVRSILVGAIASIIDIILFTFLTDFLSIHYLISNTISFSIGLMVSYYLNISWIFIIQSNKSRHYEFFKFFGVAIVGLMISQLVLWFCIEHLMIVSLGAKIIATLTAFIWNFLARKYLVFKNK